MHHAPTHRRLLAVLALAACHADPAPGVDTDPVDSDVVDTEPAETDPVDTEPADSDVPPPFPTELVAGGAPVLDPEFWAPDRHVVWQSPTTGKVWVAGVDEETGQFVPRSGRGIELGVAAPFNEHPDHPGTINGPEWGARGRGVWFTTLDEDGVNTPARFLPEVGHLELLVTPDGIHRSGTLPQLFPPTDDVAYVYFRGHFDALDTAWRWSDDAIDRTFLASASADPSPRWIPEEDAFLFLLDDAHGDAQVTRHDLRTGQDETWTTDPGDKTDVFVLTDPADGARRLCVAITEATGTIGDLAPNVLAIYREGDDHAWTRERTIRLQDFLGEGRWNAQSPEPFVYAGAIWLSFTVTASDRMSGPSDVAVAKADGSTLILLTTSDGSTRQDPEVLVLGDRAFLYYNQRHGAVARTHVVRDFLPAPP